MQAAAAAANQPVRPPAERGTLRALLLALLMHGLLFVLLAIGVNWQSRPPAGAEAELWDAAMQAAAEAEPEPQPSPAKTEPALPTEIEKEADIALEAKKRKEQREAEQQAQVQAERQRLLNEQKRAQQAERDRIEKAKAEQQKAEQARREKVRREKEKTERDKAAKDKADKERLTKEQAARDKLAAEKAAKDKAQQERARAEQLVRLQGAAGAGGSGDGQGASSGGGGSASPGYADRIRRRVEQFVGNEAEKGLTAVVLIRLAPNGDVLSRRLVTRSGNETWDQAVLRAIDQASPLPKDVGGIIPREVLNDGVKITFRSKN